MVGVFSWARYPYTRWTCWFRSVIKTPVSSTVRARARLDLQGCGSNVILRWTGPSLDGLGPRDQRADWRVREFILTKPPHLTPTSIKFNYFLKLIILEHKPLLTCFGFVKSQKWLV